VPALPSSILEPLWIQFAALLPTHHDAHPLGCHRPRIPDRIVFDKLIQVLVFGCGYRRIADHSCSATTLRRRRDEWITAGIAEQLRLAVLAAYDRLFGLEVEHLSVDGCITKAPCGGQVAGLSPIDRRKQGLGGDRDGWHPAGGGGGPGQPPRRWAAGCHPGRRHRHRPAAQAAHSAPGRRLRLPALPGGASGTGHGQPDRHARRAGTGPGGAPLGDRAHSRLGQPVQQAALVHRAPPAGGRVLAGAGPCGHYPGSPDPPCLDPLPLGRPSPPPP
jgi:hypothetical protein